MLQYFVLVFLRNKVQTSLKVQGNVLLLNSKAHKKIQALLKEKETSPEKDNVVSLAPSHSIIDILTGKMTKIKTIAHPMRPISR